jgi:hypothetical protein
MSNGQLDALAIGLLAAHLAVLGLAIAWRNARPAVIWLNAVDAACALVWLSIHPLWIRLPPDWLVLGWAVFELIALAVSALALRRVRAAVVVAWAALGLHTLAAALAVLFALTFRITRLF